MKRVLVTGGAGFIGSHLCESLVRSGHQVIALDSLFTGSRANVAHLPAERFELVHGDVCNPFHFEVEEIWHLACPASPLHYQKNPVHTIKTGVLGTMNALELARNTGARLVFTSTSEVYGDPLVHPQPESYWGHVNPVGPRANYDESKRCGESLAVSWAKQYGTDVRIARLFNCYGPRMASGDGRLIPNFIGQARRGEPLTIYGDGSQTRSFCYVDDTVRALLSLMDAMPVGTVPVVNIGNPDERTIADVARSVLDSYGREWSVTLKPLPQDDPRQRCPDITLARLLLGWEPTVSFEEGMRRTVEWFDADAAARAA